MKINLKNNGFLKHAELFQKAVCNRISAEFTKQGMTVELQIDKAIPHEESFLIRGEADSWSIIGSDELGLYFGIGKFLHTAKWNENGFIPEATNGVVAPECQFRAMYFATHFYNFYHAGTAQALKEYVDDMLLWGYNTILSIIPVIINT